MAGLAQTRIYLRFPWQAWHSWRGVARLGVVWARGDAAPFCVAGVAQPYIHLRFTWQAWHKLTSTWLSRGRRGPTMSQAVYVLGSQGFDPIWAETCADAWRTDTYVNVRDACVCLNCVVA